MFLAIAGLFGSFRLFAASATLAWDANLETDIAGYKLSYGESPGNYTTTVDVGNRTVADVAELIQGKTYYFSVAAYNANGTTGLPSTEISYTIGANSFIAEISPDRLSVHYVDSEDPDGYLASYAIDADPDSFWHTVWRTVGSPPPHELQVDLGSASSLSGFRYLPRQDAHQDGNIGQYEFYISTNGSDWGKPVATGSFSNTKDSKNVTFTAKNGRYVRLRALTDATGGSYTNVAELSLLQAVDIPTEGIDTVPIANTQSQNANEDTPLNIALTGTDPEGSVLSYSVATPPVSGTLSGNAPNLIYTPASDFNGSDSFTFLVNDGSLNSSVATISITISPVNDAPTVFASSTSTSKNTPVPVSLNGSDKDSDALSYVVVSGPANGTLSGSGKSQTYSPKKNYSGTDSFTFLVNDGTVDSTVATVSITITPTNQAPVARAQSVTTAEDTAVPVALGATDVDENSLTYSVVANPSHGSLSGTPPNLTYTPSTDYNGSDSFTFVAKDGDLDSNLATVTITVSSFNDVPSAAGRSVTTLEDTPAAILLAGSDPESSPLTYNIASGPQHGSLSGSAPNLTYIPAADFHGSDRITFTVNDGNQSSEIATITINITPVNDLPVAFASSTSTSKNATVPVSLNGSDKDSDALSYVVVSGPANGTLSGSGKSQTYTPKKNYSGTDSFTFLVNDGTVDSTVATVSITITPTNQAPVARAQSVTTAEDTAVPVALGATDVDENSLTYSIVANPSHGSLSGIPPNLTYTPSADYNGGDSFTFFVNDGISDSRVETISISVTPENDSPNATSLILATAEEKPLPVILSGSDQDLDNLTFIMVSEPSDGTLVGTAPNLTYIPNTDFNGSDQFTFRVNDGKANSQAATVFITVTPVNDAPGILAKSLTTPEDKALSIVLEGSDSDGRSLNYSVVSSPVNGSLSGTAPNLSYSPAPNYSGSDSFTYRVNDGKLDSEIATISIEVTPVNDAPVANSVVMETTTDSPRLFVLGGSDIEGDLLAYSIVTPPINGTLSGKAPNLTYIPNRNYTGSDRITFKTHDGSLESAVATVSVTVTPREKETTIKPGIFVVNSITLQATENEPIAPEKLDTVPEAGTALSFRKASGPRWLNVSIDGILSGTPGQSDVGTNSFVVSVSDSLDLFDEATLTISVAPLTPSVARINQLPAFISNPITMADASANAPYTGSSLAEQAVDPDTNDSLRYWKVSGPAWLNVAANGELSGTPPTASTGINYFAVGVADTSSAAAYSVLKINVIGLPLPWSTTNLGTGQIAGSTSFRAGTFTQAGSGILGNRTDKLRFTYQTLSGDGEIIAKVDLLDTKGPSSCVGVMIRDSLATHSTEAFIGISDDKSYRQASRTKYGQSTSIKWVAPTGTPASWVRLVRNAKKQQIYAYKSADGVNWTHVGTTKTKMKTNCVVGLVVASGNDSTLTTSTFSNVWVAP